MKANRVKITVLGLTLFNVILLIYGLVLHPAWILVVFCAAIFQLLLALIYLQYNVYWTHSKNRSSSLNVQLENLKKDIDSVYNRIDALLSIHSILKIRQPLPILHDWRIASDYGHQLVQTILSRQTGDVLDVGSGISTLLAGYAVEKRGSGKVITLEHEEKYFKQCTKLISDHQLERYITIYHCPLVSYELNGEKWLWYDISGIESLQDVNIVSVDGPPGDLQKLSRYPLLPLLFKRLQHDAVILLDDGARKDEQHIANRWKNEFNLESEYVGNTKGLFIFKHKH